VISDAGAKIAGFGESRSVCRAFHPTPPRLDSSAIYFSILKSQESTRSQANATVSIYNSSKYFTDFVYSELFVCTGAVITIGHSVKFSNYADYYGRFYHVQVHLIYTTNNIVSSFC